MGRRRYKEKRDPYTRDGVDALELIGRMLGRTSYRVPVEGRGSAPLLMSTDIAGAVGMMRNPLARETAMTVVSRPGPKAVARLSMRAYREVYRKVRMQRLRPLDLRQPKDRWRMRIVIFDAAYELTFPERRRPYADLAKAAKMRKATYMAVFQCAMHVLQDALNSARSDFRNRLRGDSARETSDG